MCVCTCVCFVACLCLLRLWLDWYLAVVTQRVRLTAPEKLAAGEWKKIRPLTDRSGRPVMVHFVVAQHGNTFPREQHVACRIMELKQVGALCSSTTCIGVRSNVRVDDNPMVRFASSAALGASTDGAAVEDTTSLSSARKRRVGAPMDNEVGEYVLRLVVAQLGDSERVLSALKSVLGFSQAFADYVELKNAHESQSRAAQRIAEAQALVASNCTASAGGISESRDRNAEYLRRLLASSRVAHNETLAERLTPSPTFFESHLARRQLLSRSTGITVTVDARGSSNSTAMTTASTSNNSALANVSSSSKATTTSLLGVRAAAGSYTEMCETYRSLFCRMCYAYDCHEHGSEQPQPTRRADPVYPAVMLKPGRMSKITSALECSELTRDKQVASGGGVSGGAPHMVDRTMPCVDVRDPTEYFDSSHVVMVVQQLGVLLDPVAPCSVACVKQSTAAVTARRECDASSCTQRLDPSEVALVQKMRHTVGDSACTIANLLRTVPCDAIAAWLAHDDVESSSDCGNSSGNNTSARSKHTQRRRKRASSTRSHHEQLLQRARNHRLQERQTDHQYEPCLHDGVCASMDCSCMSREHVCGTACCCSRDCPNRYALQLSLCTCSCHYPLPLLMRLRLAVCL